MPAHFLVSFVFDQGNDLQGFFAAGWLSAYFRLRIKIYFNWELLHPKFVPAVVAAHFLLAAKELRSLRPTHINHSQLDAAATAAASAAAVTALTPDRVAAC